MSPTFTHDVDPTTLDPRLVDAADGKPTADWMALVPDDVKALTTGRLSTGATDAMLTLSRVDGMIRFRATGTLA